MNKLLLTVTLLVLAVPAQADLGAAEQAYAHGDYATALKALQPLAEAGDPAAQYRLGEMYLMGQGIKKDDAWAITWLRRAARQGHADAERDLEAIYKKEGLRPPPAP